MQLFIISLIFEISLLSNKWKTLLYFALLFINLVFSNYNSLNAKLLIYKPAPLLGHSLFLNSLLSKIILTWLDNVKADAIEFYNISSELEISLSI